MSAGELLPLLAVVLAVGGALGLDLWTARRGLLPARFVPGPGDGLAPLVRRAAATSVVAIAFWAGVFAPLALAGEGREIDLERLEPAQLFFLHGLFALTLGVWCLLGFGVAPARWSRQLGLRARRIGRELAVGLAAGLVAWAGVLSILLLVGSLVWLLGGGELLDEEPPAIVPWIAALPVWQRLAVALSAGVVEELFFRGFLQPRIGVGWSTALFVLAHSSYEQPLMLLGIALLSLVFAGLVHWRQSVWAAIAAHFLFDAVQLLVVVPWVLETVSGGATPAP